MRTPAHRDAARPADETATPVMKLWLLQCKDPQEPPFHFTGTAVEMIVAASSEDDARRLAANTAGVLGEAWRDAGMTACDELRLNKRCVIATETEMTRVDRGNLV